MYFEIFKDRNGYFRWHLKSGNNQIVAASEGYNTAQGALDTINAIKRSVATAQVYKTW